jgi:hypothetical protein
MRKFVLLLCLVASVGLVAQQQRRGGGLRGKLSRRIRPASPPKRPTRAG